MGSYRNASLIVRPKKECNKFCPVCERPLSPIATSWKDIVRLPSMWFFINTAWGIEFCVHPRCKNSINENNIMDFVKKVGQLGKKSVQDCLLEIGLESLKK